MSTAPPQEPLQAQEPSYRQPLLPLFALAGLTMAVGFYAAYKTPAPAQPEDLQPADALSLTVTPPEGIELPPEPVMLAHKLTEPRTHQYRLQQESQRQGADASKNSPAIQTTISFRRTLSEDSSTKRHSASFEQVHFRVSQVGQSPTAGEMTSQLEQVIAQTKASMQLQPHGELGEYRWDSKSNPELAPSLRLIQDAQQLLWPRFRREAVRPQDVWSYDLPLAGQLNDNGLTAKGALKVDNTFLGFVQREQGRFAVVSQQLSLEGQLNAGPQQAPLQGKGQGLLFFDATSGQVWRYNIVLSLGRKHDAATQSTTLRLSLSTPEAGKK